MFEVARAERPSVKARRVLAALLRTGWSIKRTRGSHRVLQRPGFPDLVFSFHDKDEIGSRTSANFANLRVCVPRISKGCSLHMATQNRVLFLLAVAFSFSISWVLGQSRDVYCEFASSKGSSQQVTVVGCPQKGIGWFLSSATGKSTSSLGNISKLDAGLNSYVSSFGYMDSGRHNRSRVSKGVARARGS